MIICWERAVPFVFRTMLLNVVLIMGVPFPFGVWDRLWNLIVLVTPLPFHLLQCSGILKCI